MNPMREEITYLADGNASSFAGTASVSVYGMAVLASALRLYAGTGMRVNRAYTPTAMMRAGRAYLAEKAEGIAARDYRGMADALTVRVQAEKARIASL